MGNTEILKNEYFYKSLIENGNEIITLFDKDFNVLYRSPANERILGYTIEEHKQIQFELIHPDDRHEIISTFRETLRQPETPLPIAIRIKAKNGNYLSFEGSIKNLLHIDGINAVVSNYHNVTNRVKAEGELAKTRENLSSLINTINGVVWEADVKTFQFTYVSHYAEKILGFPAKQWITEHDFWPNHIHPDDKDWVVNYCSNILKNGENGDVEYRMIADDGSVVWIQDIITLVKENDEPLFLRGIMMDITERHQALEDLALREHYFKNLIENSTSAIILIGADGKFLYQSPVVEKILGYETSSVSETNVFQFIHPDELDHFSELFLELLAKPGSKVSGEFRFLHNNGEYIWLGGTVKNLLHDPTINALIANYQDVTERKRAQKELEKSEANLHTIFDNADTGYILLDTNLNLISFNQPAQKFSEEDLKKTLILGKNAIDFFPNERKPFMKRKIMDALGGSNISHELTYPQSDGSNRWYFMRFYPLYNFEKKVFRVVLALTDVTERKTYELQRKKITHDLLQRNKALEQFTYIVSHNLRSPVANILGVCQLIQEVGLNEHEKNTLLQGLLSSANKLDTVITDLNQILQVKKDVRENKEFVNFSNLVKDSEATFNEWIKDEEVKIITDFFEWEGFITLKSYINSIFYNLISNSIKYRQPSIPLIIKIKSYKKGSQNFLSFKDNGLGIDLEKKGDQVFGLYKRFHNLVEGRGMGLYMVKTQVETLGGKISLKSKVNVGSEFIIEFDS
jgi:PAS domain S-box-containing protein